MTSVRACRTRSTMWLRISSLTLTLLAMGCGAPGVGVGIPSNPCGASLGSCTLSVQPSSATMHVGDTITFHATYPAAVADPRFKWSSSDSARVKVDSLLGRVRAAAVSTGTAVCAETQGLSACATVTVTP